MKQRYYFCIRYLPAQVDSGLLAGRCISQMHKFMVNNKQSMNQIGVSFPNWRVDSIGNTIAFVSEDKELLIGLSFQPYFSVMKEEELFELSAVSEALEGAPEVRFVRNQRIGKSFIGSKKRRMKRSMARAELAGVESLPVVDEDREIEHFHRIPISSGSSRQDFILHVQKERVSERVRASFNSYGFATNQDKRGTVPDIHF
ncbi:type I-F CRISPR-associated endoribonuclease Cas6/Csy4 [Vibrio sp. SCSIO 43140]|uniref:type I-F CRISPR-associated endoribonuclease Cas6/Csy4 n=1 Tax=Vibrio sp. SCSIO 43140 TaxID=2819100 RepID=UPI0020761D1C|nr:type I-F CRISPR-associated endoribonuclease Cas6/Csy4 [Vibrio sp. SCSIO 43140]USD58995.1 type I-F CRISPR-associated endoribonuclease Cas6/Csy4 [Vibrio sp. SCSIO 43140]